MLRGDMACFARQQADEYLAETLAWQAAIIAAGSSVSESTLIAADAFIAGLYADGLMSKVARLNLFAGNQLAACLTPIIGAGYDTNNGFVTGDYSESTGLTGDGISKYINTNIAQASFGTQNSRHFGCYVRAATTAQSGNIAIMGLSGGSPDQLITGGGIGGYFIRVASATAFVSTFQRVESGHFVANRTDSANVSLTKNGINTQSGALASGNLDSVAQMEIFRRGSGSLTNNGTIAGYHFGAGLSSGDLANLYTRIQAFQTALGRQV